MSAPGGDALVTDDPLHSRFELALSGSVAFIDYQRTGTRYVLTHAEVPATLRGRGIGAQLTAGALQLVRAQGGSVVARCPYVAQFIAHNAQYQDLLAPS
jgi:uncharacterized protein